MEYLKEELDYFIALCEGRIQDQQEMLEFYVQKRWDLINLSKSDDPAMCRTHGQPEGSCCDGRPDTHLL